MGVAQSLADLARQERARRESSTVESTVYTTEGLLAQYAQPIDPELLGALEGLRDSLLQFGADVAEPTAGLLDVGTGLAGGLVEMLEAFEAGSLDEIERLEVELDDPSLSGEERAALEEELSEAQRVLAEVRAELVRARLQSGELQAAEQEFEEVQQEIEAAGFTPSAENGSVPADDPAAALIAWQTAVAEQRALVQDLEDNEVRQSLEIGRLRGLVTAPTGSQQVRNQAQVELALAESQLTDIRAALDETRIELERLEADSPEQ